MRTSAAKKLPVAENESELSAFVASLGPDMSGWRAVQLAVSGLKPADRRRPKLKQAADAFAPLLAKGKGRLFTLANSDLVVLVEGAAAETLADVAAKAASVFGEGAGRLARIFDLESGRAALLSQATQSAPNLSSDSRKRAPGKPIAPSDLVRVEAALADADVESLIRRQTVCQLIEGEKHKPVFRELYVSIADLEAKVAPGVKLAADRWLFQHLTRALDARVLTQLAETSDTTLARNVSLNLNVSSVMSPQFLAFDQKLKPEARATIVLELQLVDILADMGAFLFARDFAHERGYGLCIDGLTYLTAPLTDRVLLGLDLVKVIWTPEMATDTLESRRNAFSWMIDKCGDGRAILCRCDDDDAIRFGQSIGITLFQGMAVDRRIQAAG